MKLYEVPRNTNVRLLEDDDGPPASKPLKKGDIVKFHHIDGIYSYCTDKDGNKVHPAAWTEVEIVNDKFSSS